MPATIASDRASPLSRALVWSLVLHAAAVVVAALPVVRQTLEAWQSAAQQRAAVAVAPIATVEVEIVVPEVTVVAPPPTPAESFIRTDGLAEARPDPGKRRFISDRDTRAASRLPADPAATEAQPTQEGVDIPVVEVIRREQSDGEDESPPATAAPVAAASGSRPPEPEPTESTAAPEPRPASTPPEPVSPAIDPKMASPSEVSRVSATDGVPPPVEERLALTNDSNVAVTVEPDQPRQPPARATPAAPVKPATELRDPEIASRPPAPARKPPPPRSSPPPPPAGFSGLRTPTKLRGTISNQGPASVDAEDTPTGRYMKQVTSAIEKEWHRKRRQHRDFVTFGTIKLEFHVNARGEVQHLTIKNRAGANAVMQDFTLNAVLDAAIPPMPPGLTEVLDRELLLISYDIIVY